MVHIHRFASLCSFSEVAIGGTIPATEKCRAFIKDLHPKQILNMQVTIPFYQVQFQYETVRGNLRTGEKYFFANSGEHPDIDLEIEMKLKDWVSEENFRRPYRAISNVTILDIRRIAYAHLTL